jgi:hypothetical protein
MSTGIIAVIVVAVIVVAALVTGVLRLFPDCETTPTLLTSLGWAGLDWTGAGDGAGAAGKAHGDSRRAVRQW